MGVKNNVLRDKSYLFALRIIKLYQYLRDDKKEYILSKQLLRISSLYSFLPIPRFTPKMCHSNNNYVP